MKSVLSSIVEGNWNVKFRRARREVTEIRGLNPAHNQSLQVNREKRVMMVKNVEIKGEKTHAR